MPEKVKTKNEYWGALPLSVKIPAIVIIVLAFVVGISIGQNLFLPVFGLISYFCGKRCYWWAKEIKSEENIAFWIGFFFILIGVLFYYIYYKNKKK